MEAKSAGLIAVVRCLLAKAIPSDRALGKSDPYAVFQLNGQKVFKSQTKKKTLTPEWNETFEVAVVCYSLWLVAIFADLFVDIPCWL